MARARREYGSIHRRRKSDGKFLPGNYRGADPVRSGYYVRIRAGGKAVVRYAGETRAEAEQFLAQVRRQTWEEAVLGVRAVEDVTFREFAKDYVKHIERVHEETTVRNERWKIDNYLVPEFGDMPVSSIRREDLEKYLNKRSAEGVSVSTRNRDVALLSAMFKRAVALNHARANPAGDIARPKEAVREVPFLSIEEQTALVAACPESLRALVAVAIDTGMRRGELLRLTWPDVDLGRSVLVVRKAKNKTPREVPLRSRSAAILKEMRERRTVPLHGPDRVFSWVPESFSGDWGEMLAKAAEEAKIPRLRFHDLRHVAAVNLVRAGVPLPDVGRFLGHKTLVMVLRYGHHAPKDAGFRALDALEAYHARAAAPETRQAAPG